MAFIDLMANGMFFTNSGIPLKDSSGINRTNIVTYLDPGGLPSQVLRRFASTKHPFFKIMSFSLR